MHHVSDGRAKKDAKERAKPQINSEIASVRRVAKNSCGDTLALCVVPATSLCFFLLCVLCCDCFVFRSHALRWLLVCACCVGVGVLSSRLFLLECNPVPRAVPS